MKNLVELPDNVRYKLRPHESGGGVVYKIHPNSNFVDQIGLTFEAGDEYDFYIEMQEKNNLAFQWEIRNYLFESCTGETGLTEWPKVRKMGQNIMKTYLPTFSYEEETVITSVRSLPRWQQWFARRYKFFFKLLQKEELYVLTRKHSHKYGYDAENKCGTLFISVWYEYGNGEVFSTYNNLWSLKLYEEDENETN
jgi:hypothetical protein